LSWLGDASKQIDQDLLKSPDRYQHEKDCHAQEQATRAELCFEGRGNEDQRHGQQDNQSYGQQVEGFLDDNRAERYADLSPFLAHQPEACQLTQANGYHQVQHLADHQDGEVR